MCRRHRCLGRGVVLVVVERIVRRGIATAAEDSTIETSILSMY